MNVTLRSARAVELPLRIALAALALGVAACTDPNGALDGGDETLDAGFDAGRLDGGRFDAGRADAGRSDAGDTGTLDADAADLDASFDAGDLDAGDDPVDGGMTSVDGGTSDAGIDAGPPPIPGCDTARFRIVTASILPGGAVRDTATGLLWARWTQLNALPCSSAGMRVPTEDELRTLLVPRGTSACLLDECAFPGDRCGPYLAEGGRAIDFLTGQTLSSSSTAFIRCVR